MTARLTPADMLAAWEAGADRSALDRALVLLWAGGTGEADLAGLPLERRDRALLGLRAASFGDAMACLGACPACGEAIELDLSAARLAEALPPGGAEVLALPGGDVVIRSFDSRDLAAAAACPAPEAARAILVERVVDALPPGPEGAERAAIAARVEARAADAEIVLALDCPACGHGWAEVLDVARFVWAEVEAAALRLMGEVAEIARAFHWSEADILAMTPLRRRAYLSLARGQ